MNLELIKKYEKEFLHMLHGGKVLMGKKDLVTNTIKWYPSVLNPFVETSNTIVVVIDDIYCTYRMALAEGKTVQFFNTKERLYDSSKPLHTWQDIDKIHTHGRPSDYRIKSEEPKIKVGDWVENSKSSLRIIKQVTAVAEGCDTVTVGDKKVGINVMLITDLKLWEPKEGEICIFWKEDSEYNRAVIGRLKQILPNGNYVMDYGSGCTVTYSKCMPFTGALPPHMKDN